MKTRPYSILIQESEGSSAFDEQKVKNIAIKYRLQSILPYPASVLLLLMLLLQKNCMSL